MSIFNTPQPARYLDFPKSAARIPDRGDMRVNNGRRQP